MIFLSWDSPVGPLFLGSESDRLTRLAFGGIPAGSTEGDSPLLREALAQLQAYFEGQLHSFSLPLDPRGTAFQRRVWAALEEIPYGETRSYAQLARAAGCPRGMRAVGMANRANPLPILIPCHRVIHADGSLGGYNGRPQIKAALLALEAQAR